MTLHITVRIIYIRERRPQYRRASGFGQRIRRARWSHARGGCHLLSLLPVLTLSTSHLQPQNKSAGLEPPQKAPPVSSVVSSGLPAGGDVPWRREHRAPRVNIPARLGAAGGGGAVGGQVEEGGAAAGRTGATGHLARPGEQERLRRHPRLQAKLKQRDKPVFLCHCPDAGSLRTDLRCWGRTVATGRWKGRSWHL